jgi:S-(hydroxymethyl)glutathione synthase
MAEPGVLSGLQVWSCFGFGVVRGWRASFGVDSESGVVSFPGIVRILYGLKFTPDAGENGSEALRPANHLNVTLKGLTVPLSLSDHLPHQNTRLQFQFSNLEIYIIMALSFHPSIDNGFAKGSDNFPGGTLHCHCPKNSRVEVAITGNVLHNHICGCSKCWKPAGALFAVIAVVPVSNVKVIANEDQLIIVDKSATIQRHACKQCGVHLFGRIENEHAFKGLDFVHVELSDEKGWQEPQFAAFVSSIIEQGFDPKRMDEVRAKFKSFGLEPYDVLSPPLMDALSEFSWKTAGKL